MIDEIPYYFTYQIASWCLWYEFATELCGTFFCFTKLLLQSIFSPKDIILLFCFKLEDEVEKLPGDHRGLVHSNQALRLSRLMVRAETMEQRIMLLKILQVFDNQFHVSLVESLSKKVGRIKSCWKQELLFKWKTWHRVACVDFYSLCMDLLKISMYGLNKSLYKQAKLLENSI